MTDARATFTAAAVRWAGGGDPVALVDAAARALADGLDSPTLRRLAGARRVDAAEEADTLAPATFEELGLAIEPWGSPAAIDAGGWQVLRDLVDGRVAPRDAAHRLEQACVATRYETDLSTFAGYEDRYRLVEAGELDGTVAEVDDDLRRHAAEHLADRPVAHEGARPLPVDDWYRLGGWMVVAHDPGVALWAYPDVPGHAADPEVWRGTIPAGDDLPEDWEPTGIPLSTFPRRPPPVVHRSPGTAPVAAPAPRRRRGRDLAGAVVLGVATIFVPKARIDDHWSTSPKVELHEESASEASGPPRRRRRPRR